MNIGRTLSGRNGSGPTGRQRSLAFLRLVLGLLQIAGASAGLYLLLRTGITSQTVIIVSATAVVSLLSRTIFRTPQ